MKACLALTVALFAVMAGLGAACGDGGDKDSGDRGTATSETAATETPNTEFEALRDRLRERLDAFGANIGAVPDDVRDQILTECLGLQDFADREEVDQICRAIGQAIEDNDPGLVDLILERLTELEPS